MGIKQQFCTFHTKQLINREIRNFIKQKSISEDEIELIYDYKELFFDIIDADSIKDAQEKINRLFYLKSDIPKVIHDLASNLIIPEIKKITNHLTDTKIALTSNKIEKLLPKKLPQKKH